MDFCSIPTASHDGSNYFLSITDDYSRKVTAFLIKRKSDVFSCFTRYQKRAERFLNNKVVNVRIDNGLEFFHKEFCKFLDSQGIEMERTNTYSPEMNGVGERFNYTPLDAIRAMLRGSGLSNKFWSEALLCFTYTWNHICHKNQTKTPFELCCGKKPSVKHLKTFGCKAYGGVPKQLRNKLNMEGKKGIMVGYAMQTKGYRVRIPEEEKVIETCNVSFNESVNGEAVLDLNNKSEYTPLITEESESETEIREGDEIPCENLTWIRKAVPRPNGTGVDIYYGFKGRPLRFRSYCDVEKYCRAHNIKFNKNFFNFSKKDKYSGPVPKGESSTNKDKWFVAMKEEINIMSERCVRKLVPRPEKEKHTERTFYNQNGSVKSRDSGYWTVPLDYKGPKVLDTFIDQIKDVKPVDCDAELACGMPFYIPVISLLRISYYIPASKPKVHGTHKLELVSKTLINSYTYRLSFVASGPDHVNAIISPRKGVSLTKWSLTEEPFRSLDWVDRPTYFLYYSYGEYTEPWTFSIDLTCYKTLYNIDCIGAVEPHYLSQCLAPADNLDRVFFHPELPVHVNKQADLPAYLKQLALERIGDIPQLTPFRIQRRNPDGCSVFRSELIGIDEALGSLASLTNGREIWILSDSRSAIQHLSNWQN
ncbi:retrovirus-related Pol polyprotein from transposon TNT 1-94, partial [Trichonephila clavipes]